MNVKMDDLKGRLSLLLNYDCDVYDGGLGWLDILCLRFLCLLHNEKFWDSLCLWGDSIKILIEILMI